MIWIIFEWYFLSRKLAENRDKFNLKSKNKILKCQESLLSRNHICYQKKYICCQQKYFESENKIHYPRKIWALQIFGQNGCPNICSPKCQPNFATPKFFAVIFSPIFHFAQKCIIKKVLLKQCYPGFSSYLLTINSNVRLHVWNLSWWDKS